MGLKPPLLHFIETSIEEALGKAKGLRMLELGDQLIPDAAIPENTGKAFFENRGFEHVSVDLNGRHGAVVRDLTKPEQFEGWHGYWDVVTNAGTTEHVEPFDQQYECFGIIHDCLKVGGIAIHMVPNVDERDEHNRREDHCRYFYSKSFFETLAEECKYELLSNTVISGLNCASMKKVEDVPFMGNRAKFLTYIAQREMRVTWHGRLRHSLAELLRSVGLR